MSNVIQFPDRGNVKNNTNVELLQEEVKERMFSVKMEHIHETLSTVVPNLFNTLEVAGFSPTDNDIDTNVFIKDGLLIIESLKSILYKHYNIPHPMQEIANSVFEQINEDEYDLVKKLEIDFTPNLKESNQ